MRNQNNSDINNNHLSPSLKEEGNFYYLIMTNYDSISRIIN